MPSLERRVTALEVAMIERTAEQQSILAWQNSADRWKSNTDDRINAIADGLMEHRREVAERFDRVDARFDQIDERFDGIDARLNGVDARFDGIDERFNGVDARFDRVESEMVEMRDMLARVVAKLDA